MSDPVSNPGSEWMILLIEDDKVLSRQIKEFLSDEIIDSRRLSIQEINDFDHAFGLIRERKADLAILDIYRGEARAGGERPGEEVLARITETGFVCVVIYTALPEGLEHLSNQFVRLVPKVEGLAKLGEQIQDLFRMRIPQMHRAVINHLDSTLRDYMWKFVQPNWEQFAAIADKPEFLRLILQRLAFTFAHEGVEKLTAEVFEDHVESAVIDPEDVHPCEYYFKPPIGVDPLLGNIYVRETGGSKQYLVVLWPSCDMISTRGRVAKTDRVLCAKATLLEESPEVGRWRESLAKGKEEGLSALRSLLKNQRAPQKGLGSAERYHYLPGAWDIPDLVVDFQALEHIELETLRRFPCLATLASPFSGALATRFGRYLGRPGTPDLDIEMIIEILRQTHRS